MTEVISGGSVRLECEGRAPDTEAVLWRPLVVVGAEPGDVIVVDVLGVGRQDGGRTGTGHPGVIGCAPGMAARGRDIGGCSIAPLTAGSLILLPVHVFGAKLSVGDLHFPARGSDDCRRAAMAGWIDLRINLTKRGVERFRVSGPMLMPDPQRAA